MAFKLRHISVIVVFATLTYACVEEQEPATATRSNLSAVTAQKSNAELGASNFKTWKLKNTSYKDSKHKLSYDRYSRIRFVKDTAIDFRNFIGDLETLTLTLTKNDQSNDAVALSVCVLPITSSSLYDEDGNESDHVRPSSCPDGYTHAPQTWNNDSTELILKSQFDAAFVGRNDPIGVAIYIHRTDTGDSIKLSSDATLSATYAAPTQPVPVAATNVSLEATGSHELLLKFVKATPAVNDGYYYAYSEGQTAPQTCSPTNRVSVDASANTQDTGITITLDTEPSAADSRYSVRVCAYTGTSIDTAADAVATSDLFTDNIADGGGGNGLPDQLKVCDFSGSGSTPLDKYIDSLRGFIQKYNGTTNNAENFVPPLGSTATSYSQIPESGHAKLYKSMWDRYSSKHSGYTLYPFIHNIQLWGSDEVSREYTPPLGTLTGNSVVADVKPLSDPVGTVNNVHKCWLAYRVKGKSNWNDRMYADHLCLVISIVDSEGDNDHGKVSSVDARLRTWHANRPCFQTPDANLRTDLVDLDNFGVETPGDNEHVDGGDWRRSDPFSDRYPNSKF